MIDLLRMRATLWDGSGAAVDEEIPEALAEQARRRHELEELVAVRHAAALNEYVGQGSCTGMPSRAAVRVSWRISPFVQPLTGHVGDTGFVFDPTVVGGRVPREFVRAVEAGATRLRGRTRGGGTFTTRALGYARAPASAGASLR